MSNIWIIFLFLHISVSIFLQLFVEKTIFFSLNQLCAYVKTNMLYARKYGSEFSACYTGQYVWFSFNATLTWLRMLFTVYGDQVMWKFQITFIIVFDLLLLFYALWLAANSKSFNQWMLHVICLCSLFFSYVFIYNLLLMYLV